MNKCIQVFCFLALFFCCHSIYAEVQTMHGSNTGGSQPDLDAEKQMLDSAKRDFETLYNSLPASAKGAINSHCDGNGEWIKSLESSVRDISSFNHYLAECDSFLTSLYNQWTGELEVWKKFGHSTDLDILNKVFPTHHKPIEKIHNESNEFMEYQSREYNSNIVREGSSYLLHPDRHGIHQPALPRADLRSGHTKWRHTAKALFNTSSTVGLLQTAMEDKVFYDERKEFLKEYGCGDSLSVADCFAQKAGNKKLCLEKLGFKECRSFLNCSEERLSILKELSAELSGKDKKGMTSICQKAATQGAQCCMNPDQCPTDGPFRSIAGQLKQAAPGLIRQWAGFKNITGKNQAACRAGLLSNAAGPLAGLQTKTCSDSSKICEKTCDEKVQDFKERLKRVIAGDRLADGVTIDDLVRVAKQLNEGEDIPEDEDTITTCSLMLVKLNRDFKKRDEDKKLRGLTEQLSHADIVDCSEQVNKYALHRRRGGGLSAGASGINPFAAGMCRGAAGSKFALPKGNFTQTPNPKLGSAHLLGGKTVPGTGGSAPYTSGPGGLPEEEFIEPERGLAGADQLTGGWTESPGDSLGASPGGASGGSQQTPSGNEPGSKEPWDTSPTAMQEAFDFGESNGEGAVSLEDMSPEERERWKRALEMEAKDTKKLMEKTPLEHFKNRPGEATIFDRMSRIHREWCKRGNCISPEEWEKRQAQERNKPLQYSQ